MTGQPEIYAIDFGTSNSLLAAASRDATFPPIPLDPGHHDPSVLRSVLHFSDEARWSFGQEALATYVQDGLRGRLLRSLKRFLPAKEFEETRIGTRRLRLPELVGVFLRAMRERANRHFDADVRRVLLGRPARFSDDPDADLLAETRLADAARIAGFTQIHFCPEPVAAAYDFAQGIERALRVLVADFGGGTSDYTVIHLAPRAESAEVLSLGGLSLAGDALDGTLMRNQVSPHFGANVTYKAPFGANVLKMPRPLMEVLCSPAHLSLLDRRDVRSFLADVRGAALGPDDRRRIDQLLVLVEDALGFQVFEAIERTKRALSSEPSAVFEFDYPGIEIRESVTRADFEAGSAPITSAILERMDATLARSGLSADDVDLVCSTGGTAKVPVIAEGLRARFGAAKLRELQSFHSVILGLAERARALLNEGDAAVISRAEPGAPRA